MSETLHILRKDLKRLRWLLVVWIAVLLARVAFWSLGTGTRGGVAYELLVSQSTGAVGALQMLMLGLLAARLVHEEPLVGWDAFWLTRPYSRNGLMASKLLFAAGVFVALPLVADLAIMATYHAGTRAQAAAAPTFIWSGITWTLVLLALAAITSSLSTFVLTIVGSLAALSLLFVVLLTVTVFLSEPSTTGPMVSDPVPGLVATLVANVAMLAAIVYQYRHRRWRTAAAIGVAGLVASLAIPTLWQAAFGRRPGPDPGAWSRDPATTAIVVDRRWHSEVPRNSFREEGPPKREVYAAVRLANMPRNFYPLSVSVDSTLTLVDGRILRSRQSDAFNPPLTTTNPPVAGAEWPGHLAATRAALGDVTLIRGQNEGDFELWPALIALNEQDYADAVSLPGRLDANVRFDLNRTRLRGTLPVTVRAALDDGVSRIEIVSAERGADGLTVAIRRWKASSPATASQFRDFTYVLRNQTRREALTAVDLGSLPTPSTGAPFLFSMFGARNFSVGDDSSGFSLQARRLRYPSRILRPGESRTFDTAWFDEAELAVLETAYAGSVTRTVRIDDFVAPVD